MENYFQKLNDIDVNDKTEKKNGLTYLSWAWAWAEVKKLFPDATYTIYENQDGLFYHTDGNTCWVKTGVTVNGIEHIEYLPVMDFRNQSIPKAKVTSFDVNKTIQRSLTKACARHGLGLYVYAGEDLPEVETTKQETARAATADAMKNLELIVAAVKDASSANEALVRVDKMNLSPEMTSKCKNAVAKKAMQVGCTYDKKTGFFVRSDS